MCKYLKSDRMTGPQLFLVNTCSFSTFALLFLLWHHEKCPSNPLALSLTNLFLLSLLHPPLCVPWNTFYCHAQNLTAQISFFPVALSMQHISSTFSFKTQHNSCLSSFMLVEFSFAQIIMAYLPWPKGLSYFLVFRFYFFSDSHQKINQIALAESRSIWRFLMP